MVVNYVNATILTKKHHDLQTANEKQQQKRKHSNRQIAYTGGLRIQKAQSLIQHEDESQKVSTTRSVGAASTASHPSIQTLS